jgi:hypothetical protein
VRKILGVVALGLVAVAAAGCASPFDQANHACVQAGYNTYETYGPCMRYMEQAYIQQQQAAMQWGYAMSEAVAQQQAYQQSQRTMQQCFNAAGGPICYTQPW